MSQKLPVKITWEIMERALLYLMETVMDKEEDIDYFKYRKLVGLRQREAQQKIDTLANKINMIGDLRVIYHDMECKFMMKDIEKQVNIEKEHIDANFEHKLGVLRKRYVMDLASMRMAAKMSLLNHRHRLVVDIVEEAKIKLYKGRKGDQFKTLIKNLMLSGTLAIMDQDPVIRVSANSQQFMNSLIPDLKIEMQKFYKKDCNPSIDKEIFPNGNIGSLRIYTSNYNCFTDMSVSTHFDQCVKKCIPHITRTLIDPGLELDVSIYYLKLSIMKVKKSRRTGEQTRYIIKAEESLLPKHGFPELRMKN